MGHVIISRTQRDAHGDAGPIEAWGWRETVEEAKAYAMALARTNLSSLWWKDFSSTTWGLMDGQRYTGVLVSDCSEHYADQPGGSR